jgi:predicted permease
MQEIVVGDLDEEFARALGTGVPRSIARRRYWRQSMASVAAGWRSADRPEPANRARWRDAGRLSGITLDLRQAARVLRRTPAFSGVAVLSLAIGIGANTAVFGVLRALLVRPLAVDRPDELALVYWAGPAKNAVRLSQINGGSWQDPRSGRSLNSNFTYPMFEAIQRAAGASLDVFAFNALREITVAIDGRPPILAGGLLASGRYFSALGIGMAAGRPFGEHDDRSDAPATVVVSHGFWVRALGGDPSVIGRVLRVNGTPVEIVGITAPDYRGLSPAGFVPPPDLTIPLAQQPAVMPRWNAMPAAGTSMFTSDLAWVQVMARVRASRQDLERDLLQPLRHEYARLPGAEAADLPTMAIRLLPGRRGLDELRTDLEPSLLLIAGVGLIVLAIASLNLAGLLLARGIARQRELAVRRALGAGRDRIVRVLLGESLLLAGAGGVLGFLLAFWARPLVASMLASSLGAASPELEIDWQLVAAAALIALATALLAGLIPAIRLSSRAVDALVQRGAGAGARIATGRALIAFQIAVSVPLLVGAGLLLRTLHNLGAASLGFDPNGVVVFRIDPRLTPGPAADDPVPLYDRILEHVRALPGVTAGAVVENVLVSGRTSNLETTLDGARIDIHANAVGPGFFDTMNVPIVAGRPIDARDRAGAPPVIVINETAAAKYFPGSSPLGRHLRIGRRDAEIVGVAGTTLYRNLRTPPPPIFYDSYAQRSIDNMPGLAQFFRSGAPSPIHVVLRTSAPPAALIAAIPEAVREVAPDLPVTELRTHVELIDSTIGRERLVVRLLVAFGGFAILLACIGLHGVTAYTVTRRTSEIGIRVALGARRAQVLWLILRQVLAVALAGVALGVPIAIATGPLVGALLFGLAPGDAGTIAAATVLVILVALVAGWLPAHRAARLPVLAALRRE